MIQISADTRRAVVTNKEVLTVGSAGIEVQFTLSEDWDGLSKMAVFRQGDDGQKVDVVLDSSLTCVVPPEVLTLDGEVVFIGVYGHNGQGTVIIPTIWAAAGIVKPGTEPATPASAEPTPAIWAQILDVAQDAEETATEAMSLVESGLQDLTGLEASVEAAESSRVNAEDERVQAETDRAAEFANWEGTIASKVPNTRTVNGKALSTDITLDAGDIGYDGTETYQSGTVGAELSDLTRQLSDLDDDKQDAPATAGTAGQVLALDDNLNPVWADQSGGGGGTTDYAQLSNKPTINNVELSGNKTLAELGINAGSVGFDETGTYTDGSVGKELSDQKNAISQLETRLKSGAEEDAELHLGFYLDENGDLCQVEEDENNG